MKKWLLFVFVAALVLAGALQWAPHEKALAGPAESPLRQSCPPGYFWSSGHCYECATTPPQFQGPECFSSPSSSSSTPPEEEKTEPDPEKELKAYKVGEGSQDKARFAAYCFPYNRLEIWQIEPDKKLITSMPASVFLNSTPLGKFPALQTSANDGNALDWFNNGDGTGKVVYHSMSEKIAEIPINIADCAKKTKTNTVDQQCEERIRALKGELASVETRIRRKQDEGDYVGAMYLQATKGTLLHDLEQLQSACTPSPSYAESADSAPALQATVSPTIPHGLNPGTENETSIGQGGG